MKLHIFYFFVFLESNQEQQNQTKDQLSATYKELEEKRKMVDQLKNQYESAQSTIKEDSKLKSQVQRRFRLPDSNRKFFRIIILE